MESQKFIQIRRSHECFERRSGLGMDAQIWVSSSRHGAILCHPKLHSARRELASLACARRRAGVKGLQNKECMMLLYAHTQEHRAAGLANVCTLLDRSCWPGLVVGLIFTEPFLYRCMH